MPEVKFRAKFEVVLQKQFLSVVENHSKSLKIDCEEMH